METATARCETDRRKPAAFFNRYMLSTHGRRVAPRRSEDRTAYVDQYEWPVAAVAISIVCMSVLDAIFTLRLLDLGAYEMNAFMAVLIEENVQKFVAFKVTLTTLSVLLLVIHKNTKLSIGISVNRVAHAVFAAYLTLMCYELYLLKFLSS